MGGSGSAQTLSVNSAPFTGTMAGNSVRLTFAVPYFLRAHAHGRLNGSDLTMMVPQSDGTARQATFSQSDKAGYDHAIARLHARIRHAAILSAKQQASSQRQPAHAQVEQSTQRTLNALDSESGLAVGGKLAAGLAGLADTVQAARSHLAREKLDASGANKYCSAALTVTGDSEAVGGALQHAQGAILSLMPDITAVRHDIATTAANLRHLRRSGLPVPSRASDVIATANSRLRQAIVTANVFIDQVNAIAVRAITLSDNMAVRRCSGARSGVVPRPIPPIAPASGNQH